MLRALEEYSASHERPSPAGFLGQAVEEVILHETEHLVDADRFLTRGSAPVRWFRMIKVLVSEGFSARGIEEWLELRAQRAAIIQTSNPHLALANCTSHQPATRYSATAHGLGYARLLKSMVRTIDRSPEDYPQIDRGANYLQQLDRLSADQIRDLARRVD